MSDDEEEDVVYGFGVGDEVELAPGWEDVIYDRSHAVFFLATTTVVLIQTP